MELFLRSPYLLFASNYQFMVTQNKHPMGGGRNLKSGPQRRSEGGLLDQHNVAPRAPARKLFWAARESNVAREISYGHRHWRVESRSKRGRLTVSVWDGLWSVPPIEPECQWPRRAGPEGYYVGILV